MTHVARDFSAGETVEVKGTRNGGRFDGRWEVAVVNPVNVKLVRRDGTGQITHRLNCSPSYMHKLGEAPAAPALRTAPLWAGTLVRSSHPKMAGKLYVVIKTDGSTVNVALLGGEGGRYWRCPADWLTVADPAGLHQAAA